MTYHKNTAERGGLCRNFEATGGFPVPMSRAPILDEAEVARRMSLLTELHGALGERGFRCILARNHRLVLHYGSAPTAPSGLTNPTLHVFLPNGVETVTTDGVDYALPRGRSCPVTDPAAAVAAIASADVHSHA